jgi:hypothetical protein
VLSDVLDQLEPGEKSVITVRTPEAGCALGLMHIALMSLKATFGVVKFVTDETMKVTGLQMNLVM